ncbi:hypothetical protein F5Y17DRAFT_443431 [Xylariaceae sp. FL0594]|nr:hypothetical protein F5Y17DRAFT_443431 [Xylariaceae sp. FL0594]
MVVKMAQHRQGPNPYGAKDEDPHRSHHPTQQHPAQQHQRPLNTLVPPHHQQTASAQTQHAPPYSSHSLQSYQVSNHSNNPPHNQDIPYYSGYSGPGTTNGYTSADTSEMMSAGQLSRPPYPPMSYHNPQTNPPASVSSPTPHDHRNIYGQPTSQLQHQQSIYYGGQQPQYSSLPPQAPQPYQNSAPTSQPMTSMLSQTGPQHQMPHHNSQQPQAGITGSPRHSKLEPHMAPQLQRPSSGPLGTPQPNQNGGQLSTPAGSHSSGINNNAAPGPIPATTPLVVRQDNNGVQWIAFEYSRDRVKMEYTIRCDVESVNTDELGQDFKTENCVYPRACCPKDMYRGNRLVYESECNTVGWALAQLNPCLRGKRGLIQRAVDSWRNSNQDPRLRSRRVRRMAKLGTRKANATPHPPAPHNTAGGPVMPPAGGMGPGSGSQMHHHHSHDANASGGGTEVEDGVDVEGTHHHRLRPTLERELGPEAKAGSPSSAHVFAEHPQQYPSQVAPAGVSMGPLPTGLGGARPAKPVAEYVCPDDLFPKIPEDKKRRFVLVECEQRQTRLRVRVLLERVNTVEIPDSFRRSHAVYPRSYFPREMQERPPDATGAQVFKEDASDGEGEGDVEVYGGHTGEPRASRANDCATVMLKSIPVEAVIPRIRKSMRRKEVYLNEIACRLAWMNGRACNKRTKFLQRAVDAYRHRSKSVFDGSIEIETPHFEVRRGKRRLAETCPSPVDDDDDDDDDHVDHVDVAQE